MPRGRCAKCGDKPPDLPNTVKMSLATYQSGEPFGDMVIVVIQGDMYLDSTLYRAGTQLKISLNQATRLMGMGAPIWIR